MKTSSHPFPELGFGLGLRIPHYAHIFEHWPAVDWFEVISENFMDTGGRARRNLDRIRERYPVVMHGVALSIGTVDPLNSEYLYKLKKLADEIKPAWITDHLCWTGVAHKNTHDLLPVPYTEEALKHIVTRIRQVQDFLGRPIALENPSTYLEFKASHIPEAEFIAAMARESGCHLLLDVNNVYVSCYNHRLDPEAYINALPLDKVVQIHLSGHENRGTHIIDTHDDHVIDEVWALYRYVTRKAGRVINTMVEWDDKLPPFDVLMAELIKAKEAAKDVSSAAVLPSLKMDNNHKNTYEASSLVVEQTRMQSAVIEGDRLDSKPDEWIRSKEGFAPAAQLAVYVNAYRYRLYDVTAEDYPVLKYYLGPDVFDGMIEKFINTAQSSHFNIGKYASHLPDFVTKHLPADVFAQQLTLLENAVTQMMDPEETEPLTPGHLAGMTEDMLLSSRLHLRKALQLFELDYDVNAYYIAVKNGDMPAISARKKTYIAVFRHEDVVWRMELGVHEYALLHTLFEGMTVGAALEKIQNEYGVSEEAMAVNLAEWFSRWIRNGLLAYESASNANSKGK